MTYQDWGGILNEGNAALEAHFAKVRVMNTPALEVRIPPDGKRHELIRFVTRADSAEAAIKGLVQAVIDQFPKGGELFVRSPLKVEHEIDWPQKIQYYGAIIRCVAVQRESVGEFAGAAN